MTEEADAVTGALALLTRPSDAVHSGLEASVRYAGAEEWYTALSELGYAPQPLRRSCIWIFEEELSSRNALRTIFKL